jgi:transposase
MADSRKSPPLAELVRHAPLWCERDELLRSVLGVGKMFSSILLAHLPELGAFNRKQIAALARLASFNRDSVATTEAAVSGAGVPRSGASCIWP